jgi:hypothetical protein
MRKRTLFLAAAAALLANLALSTASQAGAVYTYTIAGSGSQTVTATPEGNGHSTTTYTPGPGGTATAPTAPAAPGSDITVATYTQSSSGNGFADFPPTLNGGLYRSQTASQVVTVTYMGMSKTITVTENLNGLAYTGAPITPGISTSGPIVIDDVKFMVYEQGTNFNVNTGKSTVYIGLESTAVPEPTSMALLGIGMASFLAFRKYFKRPAIA